MSTWFEIKYYDEFDCREAVLNSMQEEEFYDLGVYVAFDDPVEEEELFRRIKVVHDLIPWKIEIISDTRLWVESPEHKLPHLHTVLGVLRWIEGGYDHPLLDLAFFKTAMKMGCLDNVQPSLNWNGIHTFVDTKVPALEFYKAFQEFVGEVRTVDGDLIGVNYTTSVFCLTPEELSELSKGYMVCVECGVEVEPRLYNTSNPLSCVGLRHEPSDCAPLYTRQSYVDLPIADTTVLTYITKLVKLDLLVNGGKN